MEPSLAKGESVSLVSVIQEVRGHGYSDTAVQFFFICVLHISFRSVAVRPSRQLANEKRLRIQKGEGSNLIISLKWFVCS